MVGKVHRPVCYRKQRLLLFTVTNETEPELAFSPSGLQNVLLRCQINIACTYSFFLFLFFFSLARSFRRLCCLDVNCGKRRKVKEECMSCSKVAVDTARIKTVLYLMVSILVVFANTVARNLCSLRKVNLQKSLFICIRSFCSSVYKPEPPCRSSWSLYFIRSVSVLVSRARS